MAVKFVDLPFQDMLQICRSCALRGQRTALVHLVPGEERPLSGRPLDHWRYFTLANPLFWKEIRMNFMEICLACESKPT